jgi:hypothetical protein
MSERRERIIGMRRERLAERGGRLDGVGPRSEATP